MPIGTCRLCLTLGVELRDSHFLPRALYKLFRERASNSEPVVSSATKSLLSEKQAHDHLLCDECEDRFNKGGERWFLQNAWRDPDDFPLRTRLVDAGPPAFSSPDLTMFEAASVPGVDRDKLVYFGVSVFWRAAVHRWRLPSGPSETIGLGSYEDQFRRYLLGKAEFPPRCFDPDDRVVFD